ncbi:hypothetical protein C5167_042706 [Papaver somniferum]|uniref:E2F/DP family winged-helix DNA-binding domain-containing protein n=1 Tax=Papaver somniferum TaxID=3469 RepID=A0A4Y7L665_PAPSO|nr:E2F transcription factor-like E2FE [Papaver somniferum]RZC80132.1 hypothetical protein C5167_042706 [Papaver somniferum]
MKYQIQNQMNESSTEEKKDCSNEEQSYNRKQKSLGLLCSNFFNLYDDDDVEFLNLNDAANRLGVERRRMYDVVNVFEAIGVLVKKGKAQYYWKGLGGIANALKEMKEEALNDSFNISCDDDGTETLVDQQTGSSSQENLNANSRVEALAAGSSLAKCSSSSSKNGGTRTGKSLRQLTEEFVKLLLSSDGKVVALDQAAKILLTDANNSSETRCNDSKVRRLYDIANVLSSVGLIEKTHYLNSGRPAFKWLGRQKETLPVSKKRIFGTDLTNMSIKRNKTVSSMNLNLNSHNQEQDRYDLAHRHNPFGFDPTKLPNADAIVKKTVTRSQAMLNLASTHIPPYRNQGLQGLFAHYTEAWGTWYDEIGKKP